MTIINFGIRHHIFLHSEKAFLSFPPPPPARHCHSCFAGTSDLSIWLSVDPMADKYPSTSPYAYCANNPVRLVDEDGRDIWEIDENGKLINTICDDNVDQFRIIGNNGEIISESERYKYNTFSIIKDEFATTIFNVLNGDDPQCDAESAFCFMADNTCVEWEFIKTFDNIYVGTNQCGSSTNIKRDILDQGETITYHAHNHPSGIPYPSGRWEQSQSGDYHWTKDRGAAQDLENRYTNVRTYVYTKEHGFSQYNSLGPILEEQYIIKLK